MKRITLFSIFLVNVSAAAHAGGWNDFAKGFAETSSATLKQRENERRIEAATSINHGDVDALMDSYKFCLESGNTEMPPERKSYFQKRVKAAKGNEEKIEEIKQEFLADGRERRERRREFCSAQLESQKQQILQQKSARFIAEQQQLQQEQTQALQERVDAAEVAARQANARASSAEDAAASARSRASQAEYKANALENAASRNW